MQRPIVLALMICFSAAVKAQEPDAKSALKFAAALGATNAEIKVSWANIAEKPLLINIGALIGSSGLNANVEFSISAPGMRPGKLIDSSEPGVVGGRAEPLVVCLPSRAEYSIVFQCSTLWLPGYTQRLSDLRKPWTITATFHSRKPMNVTLDGRRTPYDVLRDYPVAFPFWTGELTATIHSAVQ